MSFDQALKRLREAAEDPPQNGNNGMPPRMRLIHWRDLEELLRDYDRLDSQCRMMYPPHVKMMMDATARMRGSIEEMESTLRLLRSPEAEYQRTRKTR